MTDLGSPTSFNIRESDMGIVEIKPGKPYSKVESELMNGSRVLVYFQEISLNT